MREEKGAPAAIPSEMDESPVALSKWLQLWFAEVSEDSKELMIQAVYGLWLARNEARDGRRIADARDVADSIIRLAEEWMLVHGNKVKTPTQH